MKRNIGLLLVAAVIALLPILGLRPGGAEFAGADGEAEGVISAMAPDYQPWVASLWVPPSGEIESALFALQAALGAGVIGFVLGRLAERRKVVRDLHGESACCPGRSCVQPMG